MAESVELSASNLQAIGSAAKGAAGGVSALITEVNKLKAAMQGMGGLSVGVGSGPVMPSAPSGSPRPSGGGTRWQPGRHGIPIDPAAISGIGSTVKIALASAIVKAGAVAAKEAEQARFEAMESLSRVRPTGVGAGIVGAAALATEDAKKNKDREDYANWWRKTIRLNENKQRAAAMAQQARDAALAIKNPPPVIGQHNINWKQVLGGVAVGAFSPWMGGRMLSNAIPGLGRIFGGGGGGAGGIVSGIFGAGGVPGMAVAYLALEAATMALKAAFGQLEEAVKRGSQIYVGAARTGTSTGKYSQIKMVLGAVGLPDDLADRLLMNGQFGRGRKFAGPGGLAGQLLGTNAGLGQAERQAIVNLTEDINHMAEETAYASERLAQSATAMHDLSMESSVLSSEWHAAVADLTQSLSPEIKTVFAVLKYAIIQPIDAFAQLLHGINALNVAIQSFIAAIYAKLMHPTSSMGDNYKAAHDALARFYGLDNGADDNKRIGGPGTGAHESAWERMGLISNGGMGGTDFARQTAQNTAKIAINTGAIVAQWARGGTPAAFQPNMP